MDETLIWWHEHDECAGITPRDWPEYLRHAFVARSGVRKPGFIWSPPQFGWFQVDPWPSTGLATYLRARCGGIVFAVEELPIIRGLPGLVTDRQVKRVPLKP